MIEIDFNLQEFSSATITGIGLLVLLAISIVTLILLYLGFAKLSYNYFNEYHCNKTQLTEQDRIRYQYKDKNIISNYIVLLILYSIITITVFVYILFNNLINRTLKNFVYPLILLVTVIVLIVLISSMITNKFNYTQLKTELKKIFNDTCSTKFVTGFDSLDSNIKNSILKKYKKKLQNDIPGAIYTTDEVENKLKTEIGTSDLVNNLDNFIKFLNIPGDLDLINNSYHNWIATNCYDRDTGISLTTQLKTDKRYITVRYEDTFASDLTSFKNIINLNWFLIVFILLPIILYNGWFSNYNTILTIITISITIVIFVYIMFLRNF